MLVRELTKINRNRKVAGLLLLALSAVLLTVQFWLALNTSWLPSGNDLISLVVNLIPYSIFLCSLYVLLGNARFPREQRPLRLLGVTLAVIGVAGGLYLILIVVSLFAFGPKVVNFLTSNLLLILSLLALTALPLVQRKLK